MRYIAQAEFEINDEAIIPDILTILETVLPYMTDNVVVTTWQVPMIQPNEAIEGEVIEDDDVEVSQMWSASIRP